MGQIQNDIDAIGANGSLTAQEKKTAIGQVKLDALEARITNFLPYTVVIDANRQVTFDRVTLSLGAEGSCILSAYGEFRRDGTPEAFDWPWLLVNPPMLTGGRVEDPEEALREVCDRVFV